MTDFPSLSSNSEDERAAVVRSLTGMIPMFGNLIAEIVTAHIPRQKHERVVQFIQLLAEQLQQLQGRQLVLESQLLTSGGSEVLKNGLIQASSAESDDRRKRIAAILIVGLSSEELERDRAKKLLDILASLNDSEIILLVYHSQTLTIGSTFHARMREQYPNLLRPVSRLNSASVEERNRGTFRDSYERTLINQGLLQRSPHGVQITALGRLFVESSEYDPSNSRATAT